MTKRERYRKVLEWFEENTQAHQALAQAYVHHLMGHPEKNRIALAYQNSEVYQLNQIIIWLQKNY